MGSPPAGRRSGPLLRLGAGVLRGRGEAVARGERDLGGLAAARDLDLLVPEPGALLVVLGHQAVLAGRHVAELEDVAQPERAIALVVAVVVVHPLHAHPAADEALSRGHPGPLGLPEEAPL